MIMTTLPRHFLRLLGLLVLAFSLSACEPEPSPELSEKDRPKASSPLDITAWQQAARASLARAGQDWQEASNVFQKNPQAETLTTLRESLTHWYRIFFQNYLLLASQACQKQERAVLDRLDSWPLYPGYLDSLPQWPDSGLINDTYVGLTRENLRRQHHATAREEASLGFAAMLVVLNGSEKAPRTTEAVTGNDTDQARRRRYLELAGEQLLDDQRQLTGAHQLDAGALQCGLQITLSRWQAIQAEPDTDDPSSIPPTTRAMADQHLQDNLDSLDREWLDSWDAIPPGLREALENSSASSWQPIEAWLQSHQKTPDHSDVTEQQGQE